MMILKIVRYVLLSVFGLKALKTTLCLS